MINNENKKKIKNIKIQIIQLVEILIYITTGILIPVFYTIII